MVKTYEGTFGFISNKKWYGDYKPEWFKKEIGKEFPVYLNDCRFGIGLICKVDDTKALFRIVSLPDPDFEFVTDKMCVVPHGSYDPTITNADAYNLICFDIVSKASSAIESDAHILEKN